MSERQLQFRVGLLVLVALVTGAALILRFGDAHKYFSDRYTLAIHFQTAPGVYPGTPVKKSGITIGSVKDVAFDDTRGGVLVIVGIESQYRLRVDSGSRLNTTLLGDTSIEFTPGGKPEFLADGARLEGEEPTDPLEAVLRLETHAQETMIALADTSREWQRVARNVNSLVETQRGELDMVIERAADSLHQFTLAMNNTNRMVNEANKIIADPAAQQGLRETLAALPRLVNETERTIAATRTAIDSMNRNLQNLNGVTTPLARSGETMVTRLESSLAGLDALVAELNRFAKVAANEDGSLKKLAGDPELYRNLNQSAELLAVLLRKLAPVVKDLSVFSDKVARHPELLGVGGAMRPSSGLKQSKFQPPGRSGPR